MPSLLAAESSNDLIKVVPGLMIWTLVAFAILASGILYVTVSQPQPLR